MTVISIREPYSWWRSIYVYGYVCWQAAVCTNEDFLGFMRGVGMGMWANGGKVAQSSYIQRECGSPCNADHYLRTESLSTDWLALLHKLRLPLIQLPHSNPTKERPKIPPTIFTQEICDIIHTVDEPMFTEFKYPKRECPFELS